MMTFLEAMNASPPNFTRAASTMDIPTALAGSAQQFATRLLGILNRIGEVRPTMLPDESQAQSRDLSEFRFFPQRSLGDHNAALRAGAEGEITLVKTTSGAWKFSRATIDGLADLYDSVEGMSLQIGVDEARFDISLRIRRMFPRSMYGRFLGIEYWQWAGLLLLIFLAVVLDYIVQAVLRAATTTRIRKRGGEPKPDIIRKSVRPFGLFAGALSLIATVHLLGLPAGALAIVIPAIRLILSVAGVWAAFRATDLLAELLSQRAAATDSKFDDLLIPLVRKTLKIFIAAIGLIYIAGALNIEIVPLLTGLGIGGLAVAFAAKDTIENFFGSVAVILDQPFEVGDWVKINDVEGTVEELGFRSTRIRTFYNSLVTVPNASLVRATVDNFGRRKYRRTNTTLNLTYDTPPDKIEAFCEGVRELIRAHPYTRKDYFCVYFNNFGAHSLDVLVYFFHECPDWQTELRERQRMYLDILRLADALGVEFAYPTQTLFVNPEQGDHQPAPPPGDDADIAARRKGLNAARSITEYAPWRARKPAPENLAPPDADAETQIESRVGGDAGEG
jgi:MscS family membrane protein